MARIVPPFVGDIGGFHPLYGGRLTVVSTTPPLPAIYSPRGTPTARLMDSLETGKYMTGRGLGPKTQSLPRFFSMFGFGFPASTGVIDQIRALLTT